MLDVDSAIDFAHPLFSKNILEIAHKIGKGGDNLGKDKTSLKSLFLNKASI